jgi:hypothetical protein
LRAIHLEEFEDFDEDETRMKRRSESSGVGGAGATTASPTGYIGAAVKGLELRWLEHA